jgi:TonB family protein
LRKLFALTTGLLISLSSAQCAFGQVGDLTGLSNIKLDLLPLPEKVASQESSLRTLIGEKLKAADINLNTDSTSRLQVEIKPQSSQLVLTLSVIEPVPLPSNPAIKKDLTVWSHESTCPAKRLNDTLTSLLDAFAIQYLKDNRGSGIAGRPTFSDTASVASASSASPRVATPYTPASDSSNSSASNPSTSNSNTSSSNTSNLNSSNSNPATANSLANSWNTNRPSTLKASNNFMGAASDVRACSVSSYDSNVANQFQAINTFAEKASSKIKKAWVPPKEHSQDVEVKFSIDSTGAVVEPRIVDTRVNFVSQDSAKLAIATAAPFKSFLTSQLDNLEYVVFKCSFFPTGVLLAPLADESKRRLSNAGVREITKGNFDSAIEKLELSMKFDKDYPLGKSNLAIAYNNKGLLLRKQPLLAREYFQKALSIDPSNRTTQENIEGIDRVIKSKGASSSQTSVVAADANSADKSKLVLDSSRKFVSNSLQDMWKSAELQQKGAVEKPLRIRFKLDSKGDLSDVPSNPDVYNSCGVPADDALARECVKNAAPYAFHSVSNPSAFYLATFDVNAQTVEITNLADIDFGVYMKDMQRIIKTAWFPPKGNETKRVTVRFDILSNGTTRHPKVYGSSNVPGLDDAALTAIKNVTLSPLPAGAPDFVNVEFTFDYNVFAKKPGVPVPATADSAK